MSIAGLRPATCLNRVLAMCIVHNHGSVSSRFMLLIVLVSFSLFCQVSGRIRLTTRQKARRKLEIMRKGYAKWIACLRDADFTVSTI